MGLCVVVQNESGSQISDVIADDNHLLYKLIGYPDWQSFPVLASIDRYGDTIFNRVQIEHFLREWAELFDRAKSEKELSLLTAIDRLAKMALQEVHCYLAFIGD